MPSPTITDYLKYADLQMAAEALFDFNATAPGANLSPGEVIRDRTITALDLTRGNLHASRFTESEAQSFAN